MYDIVKVELTDFRSFRGKHSLTFPTEPGLYSISGRNLENPNLGGNGIGKTSLLEAIYWCNYGRTTRGLRASDVVNWQAKSCSVTVQQQVANQRLTVTRTQSPNSLTLNGQAVDQETLQSHLRIGAEAFTYAVMIPQFGRAFFDLAPGDKLTLFSQIMELDYWLDKSKEADDLGKELSNEKVTLEQRTAGFNGQLETIIADIEGLTQRRNDFAREQEVILTKLLEQKGEAVTVANQLSHQIDETKVTIGSLEKRLDKATAASMGLTNQKLTIESEAKKLFAEKAVVETQLAGIVATLKRLDGLNAQCPTCLQKVSAAHLTAEKARSKEQRRATSTRLEVCVDAVAEAAEELDSKMSEIEAKHKDIEVIEQNMDNFNDKWRSLKVELGQREATIENTGSLIKAERQKANPYAKMIDEKKTHEAELKAAVAQTKKATEQIEADQSAVAYWVGGFKRVRLFIVEEAIRQLELEINNNLAGLGLLDWSIELDIERENKSGGITKGFTVLVHTVGHNEPVKFEAWSGGETQRLRLAGELGLANLIMERAGLTNGIEFFDEPSRHLSQEGVLDLAETLTERAVSSHKRIFIVEHNLLDYPYAGAVTILKSDEGSTIK